MVSAHDSDGLTGLEAEVLAAPTDLALLAVYADALSGAGDARGELLALQLRRDELLGAGAAIDRAIDDRIHLLTAQLLGDYAWAPGVRMRGGFLEAAPASLGPLLLPVADHARVLRLGPLHLVALTDRPRPVLTDLTIHYGSFGRDTDFVPIDFATIAPRLQRLTLAGEVPLELAASPTLRHLEVRGWAAVTWLRAHAPFPALETLTMGLDALGALGDTPLLTAERYPNLRTLDLSPAEAGEHDGRPPTVPDTVFRILAELGRVERVVLPSVRTTDDVARLNLTLAALPLREIVMARRYTDPPPAITHPTATITVPPLAPWPPVSDVFDDHLRIEVPGEPFTGLCDPFRLVPPLQRAYAEMTPAEHASWATLWAFIQELPRFYEGSPTAPVRQPFPAAVLAHALDSLCLDLPSLREWGPLRQLVGPLPSRRLQLMVSHWSTRPRVQ